MKSEMKKKRIGKSRTNRKQIGKKHIRHNGDGQNYKNPTADVPAEWFYMSHTEMTAAALKAALADTAYKVEYWEAAQVLEIVLGEAGSMDVEVIAPRLGEEDADAFLEEHRVKFLCYITFRSEDYDAAKAVMEHICGRIGGFFCGDTEDFTPVIGAGE